MRRGGTRMRKGGGRREENERREVKPKMGVALPPEFAKAARQFWKFLEVSKTVFNSSKIDFRLSSIAFFQPTNSILIHNAGKERERERMEEKCHCQERKVTEGQREKERGKKEKEARRKKRDLKCFFQTTNFRKVERTKKSKGTKKIIQYKQLLKKRNQI